MKVDINESFSKNIYYIKRYTIQINREKIAMTYFVAIPLSIFITLAYIEAKVAIALWVYLICAVVLGALVTFWSYKRIYQKNIDSIKNSLEEMRELKEEDEK